MDFVAGGTTPEDIVNFRPSAEAQQRVAELIEREEESRLTAEEAAELSHFLELEHILRLAKGKGTADSGKPVLRVGPEFRSLVAQRAGLRCEYCLYS